MNEKLSLEADEKFTLNLKIQELQAQIEDLQRQLQSNLESSMGATGKQIEIPQINTQIEIAKSVEIKLAEVTCKKALETDTEMV